jgi:hypothetical protein
VLESRLVRAFVPRGIQTVDRNILKKVVVKKICKSVGEKKKETKKQNACKKKMVVKEETDHCL